MYFCYVTEMGKHPILHIVDMSTGYSETRLCDSRFMDEAMDSFEMVWINIQGAPRNVSADIEFLKRFSKELNYFNINFQPVPARRYNKVGVVERKNSVLRLFLQKILKDLEHAQNTRGQSMSDVEILSRGKFL